jgi:hypothetical protein
LADDKRAADGGLARVFRAVQLFRPRTLAQLGRTGERLQGQIDALGAELATVREQLQVVTRKEQQLRAVIETEYALNDQLIRFDALVRELPLAEHVQAAIAAAPLQGGPSPRLVVDGLLPAEYYDALVAALPPEGVAGAAPGAGEIPLPLDFAPRYSTEVWRHMAQVVADGIMKPAIFARFQDALTARLRETLPALGSHPLERVRLTCAGDRLLSGGGSSARNAPRTVQETGFITCRVHVAPGGEGNRADAYLSGAVADAAAPARGQYIYEFRMGPDNRSRKLIRQ